MRKKRTEDYSFLADRTFNKSGTIRTDSIGKSKSKGGTRHYTRFTVGSRHIDIPVLRKKNR